MGHSSKFQRLLRLAFVTAAMSLTGGQPHCARCLAVSCAATLHIYFLGLLLPDRILPVAKFTLRPSLAFSYIGTVTAWHSGSGHQPNFAALNRGRHLYSAGRPSSWALAHISSCYCYTGGSCHFPREWRGKYFQSGLGEVIIAETHITAKGTCVDRTGDYFLVISR